MTRFKSENLAGSGSCGIDDGEEDWNNLQWECGR